MMADRSVIDRALELIEPDDPDKAAAYRQQVENFIKGLRQYSPPPSPGEAKRESREESGSKDRFP
jgi:hypothetical protein